jgi:hypothetical protein
VLTLALASILVQIVLVTTVTLTMMYDALHEIADRKIFCMTLAILLRSPVLDSVGDGVNTGVEPRFFLLTTVCKSPRSTKVSGFAKSRLRLPFPLLFGVLTPKGWKSASGAARGFAASSPRGRSISHSRLSTLAHFQGRLS